MNREQVEKELRDRLEAGPIHLRKIEVRFIASSLAPWIMEMLEEARNEGRTEPLWET